jgi:hypothetical protein
MPTSDPTHQLSQPSVPSQAKVPPAQAPSVAADQTLENIKMAYYWAGYYSGLYDGQRQVQVQTKAEAEVPDETHAPNTVATHD